MNLSWSPKIIRQVREKEKEAFMHRKFARNFAWRRIRLPFLAIFLLVGACGASADPVADAISVQNAFRAVAKGVTPAVVNISSETVVRSKGRIDPNDPFYRFFGNDELFRQFFDIPQDRQERSLGTGFIISADGYLISNFHVVKNATKIMVTMADGSKYKARIVGTDPKTDIAVLKIDGKNLPSVNLGDSDEVEVGDWAIAIGNPFGLNETVTVGIISAKGRNRVELGGGDMYQNFLQTDAPINPGNSGGPLCNIKGEIIGINTAIVAPSGGNVGIGFSIPINMVKGIIDQLKIKGKVTRGWLGVFIQELTEDIAKPLNLKPNSGILVADVQKDGPADKAGLKQGDVILQFDGKVMRSVEELRGLVAATPVGKTVPIKILRDGKERVISVTVQEMPSDGTLALEGSSGRGQDWIGMTVMPLSEELKGKYRIPDDQKSGVVITAIEEGSVAADSGLAVGDVIVKINNKSIVGMDDFKPFSQQSKGSYLLIIKRAGRTVFVGVDIDR
jgi:serine protease Do